MEPRLSKLFHANNNQVYLKLLTLVSRRYCWKYAKTRCLKLFGTNGKSSHSLPENFEYTFQKQLQLQFVF